jgi:hypothetical protein
LGFGLAARRVKRYSQVLNQKTKLLARDRIELVIEERWTPLATQTSEITAQFVNAGGLTNSRMHVCILGLYEDELDVQAALAFGELSRVLDAVGIGPLEHLAADLKAFMGDMIQWLFEGLLDHLTHKSLLRQERLLSIDPFEQLSTRKTHAIRKTFSEIDLLVARLERADQNDGNTQVNIYGGQVGILQTGSSSTASMTVHLDSTSKNEIAKALATVEKAIGEAASVPFDRAEISEMIRESKSELDKPKLNMSRLRSLMLGVAGSVQTVAALRPAYDAIKGALALVGVTLP